MTEKATCPCKHLSLRLSSQTAAEFGDLHRIVETASKSENNNTSLQLAAQHGHTAVTAYLLYNKNISVDCLKTPLHRACFSGAVSTIRLIVDFANTKQCLEELLMAPDKSFGDQRNSLHKAAAGGRFLAVHCLLEYGCDTNNLLESRDGQGQTARDIAVSLRSRQSEEARSVARWNLVAGGQPDWEKCVQLLRSTEFQSNSSERRKKTYWEPIAPHLLSIGDLSCADCSEPKEKCLTKTWEDTFRSALGSEVEESLKSLLPSALLGGLFHISENSIKESNQPFGEKHPCEPRKKSGDSSSELPSNALGQKCSKCHNLTIALYRRNGLLVCRKCR